jgi:hypothetical protein
LCGQGWDKHLVYFSSLCVFYSDSRYSKHKRMMEDWVKKLFHHYTIVRMGNITWGTNPHTLINAIRNKIKNRESFEIQDVYRYIVEKDEFLYWMDMIPDFSCEMNITGRRMLVRDVVKEYCYPWVHSAADLTEAGYNFGADDEWYRHKVEEKQEWLKSQL